jgi:hypothetical protein
MTMIMMIYNIDEDEDDNNKKNYIKKKAIM